MAACTVQLSGDMSSALSATASLAHFAGSSFLPLVDSPACCAAAAQHSDSGLTLPTLSPPAATLLQAHACAPVPVRNPMHRVSRQSKRHRDVSGTLVVPTAESGGFSCDHVHIHGAPRSHSPGACQEFCAQPLLMSQHLTTASACMCCMRKPELERRSVGLRQ